MALQRSRSGRPGEFLGNRADPFRDGDFLRRHPGGRPRPGPGSAARATTAGRPRSLRTSVTSTKERPPPDVRLGALRDADEFASVVHERAAAVARVGRRVGLDHLRREVVPVAAVLVRRRPLLRVHLADLTGGVHPQRIAPRRVADRVDRLARVGAVFRQRQPRHPVRHPVHTDQREVGRLVERDYLAGHRQLAVVVVIVGVGDPLVVEVEREEHECLFDIPDDVVVGDDEPPAAVDHGAGPGAELRAAAVRRDVHGRRDRLLVHGGTGVVPRLGAGDGRPTDGDEGDRENVPAGGRDRQCEPRLSGRRGPDHTSH